LLCEDGGNIMPDCLTDQIRFSVKSAAIATQPKSTMGTVVEMPSKYNSLKEAVVFFETAVIEQHLRANNWNQTRAAETLQIPRRTLIDKMSRYNIQIPDKKRRLTNAMI